MAFQLSDLTPVLQSDLFCHLRDERVSSGQDGLVGLLCNNINQSLTQPQPRSALESFHKQATHSRPQFARALFITGVHDDIFNHDVHLKQNSKQEMKRNKELRPSPKQCMMWKQLSTQRVHI